MRSHYLYQTVFAQLRTLKGSVTVALSGGVDSIVLLHIVAECQLQLPELSIKALHVNHGLSEHAMIWQQFCQDTCQRLNVPFICQQVDVVRKNRQSLEAIAREQRYQAFATHTDPDSIILLGQHQDDQVETFFLHLKRGSGLAGLSAMAMETPFVDGRRLIRPFLHTSRNDIEAFCKQYSLQHIEDESNADIAFDRNFLRHQILPLLNQRFTGFDHCVARSAQLLSEQQQLIDEISASDYADVADGHELSINALLNLSDIRQRNVFRYWLNQYDFLMPSKALTEQVFSQLSSTKTDASLTIKLSHGLLRRYNQKLYLVRPEAELADQSLVTNQHNLADGRTLHWLQGQGIRAAFPHEVVSVQFANMKALIKPSNKPGRNTVKHWLKDVKVPSWQRDRVPLIFYNHELVQIVGYFISELHQSSEGGKWIIDDAKRN
ncbi:tRNA lysidine(34) synthetase TilS [Pseudoalteromonas ulvae]|uniref:tRNA(Ile)-lysidine synthase n=1 Tax=Pseudoalteromonas ulvae TaxID=107327 RepID=A0A244CS46_PSEDV|nr:tRNA lysidine(34) synthetase TilS [Pseudoalteromonas ulvae]OUL58398.1 tRNA lysidine(34) synthetase TilS [Pseudoalteromonas ulvae]